jgi:hypothetical protein
MLMAILQRILGWDPRRSWFAMRALPLSIALLIILAKAWDVFSAGGR